MHIADVSAFYTPHGGGVKTYILQKLERGPRLGHEITIIAPGDEDAVVEHGPAARVIYLRAPRFPVDRKYWYFDDEAAVHAALNSVGPDFVEASSPWRSAGMVARWRGTVPRALVMHADPLSAYAYRWFEPVPRAVIDRGFELFWQHLRGLGAKFDSVVCANLELRDRLRDGGVRNTVLEPMGVEGGLFSPALRDPALRTRLLEMCELPPEAHLLVGVGRLAVEKRWPMVVDAVSHAGQHRKLGLVILGRGSQGPRILKAIAGNPHIRLLEPVHDRHVFATLLASADALVHGCEAETYCLAAAEARASGSPVIAPDRGGAADHTVAGSGVTYRAGSARAAALAINGLFAQNLRRPPNVARTMDDHFEALFGHYAALIRRRAQNLIQIAA